MLSFKNISKTSRKINKKHIQTNTGAHHDKTTRKNLHKISRNDTINFPRAAILPHAGKSYAGRARESLFRFFPKDNIRYIIYISALHNSIGIEPNIYLLHKDKHFLSKNKLKDSFSVNNVEIPDMPPLDIREHSYYWVEPELRDNFPNAKILAITPFKKYSEKILTWIVRFMKQNKYCLLFSTTDLIHHGKHFNYKLPYPERLHKQIAEEDFIYSLIQKPIQIETIKKHASKQHLMCGPYAVVFFSKIIKRLEYSGEITDYYDSLNSNDLIDNYTIPFLSLDNFVSYVSILYGKFDTKNTFSNFDIMVALGVIKSIITKQVYGGKYVVKIPKWSPFHKTFQGVFVGTSINGKTNCSYGRFETSKKESTAHKIIEAAADCMSDARDRWSIPYTKNNLDNLNYKIELLEPRSKWKKIKNNTSTKHFVLNRNLGVFLRLPSGGSATYLPVVFRENPEWTLEKYMSSLTQKAGGTGDEWKQGEIWTYHSTSYTWDTRKQKVVIA